MYDVLVVGAGPSGAYAGMRCAEKGLDVLMLDAAKFPRDKACGGIVGETAVNLLGRDVLSVLEREGTGNDLFYDWEYIGHVDRHEYFFKRRRFDHYIVQRAVAAGADLRENRWVTKVHLRPDRVAVEANGERHEAQLVIGAEGTNSVVGRAIGQSHHHAEYKYASIKAEIDLPPEKIADLDVDDPPKQKTYFFSDLMGFGWIAPNEGSVNVGYGTMMRHANGLRRRFYDFLEHLDLPPQDVRGAQIPYLPMRRVFADRVMLTGDAGGFVDPWTGCGIDDGILASERAAEVAKLAADRGDYSAATLRKFQVASRAHLRWVKGRGRWMKALDVIMPVGSHFPSWAKHVVKVTSRWA